VSYRKRIAGTTSKLQAWQDGLRILQTIASALRDIHPIRNFALLALFALLLGTAFGLLPLLPPWLRLAMAAFAAIGVLLSLATGLLLNAINTRAAELRAQFYRILPKESPWPQIRTQERPTRTSAGNT
jgi:hypothetical protein